MNAMEKSPSMIVFANSNEPICDACATKWGARYLNKICTSSIRKCIVCLQERICFAIRDYIWPATRL